MTRKNPIPVGEPRFPNPEHVKAYLRRILVHHKGVWAELARKLKISGSRLSKIMHDKVPVTQGFLDTIKATFGVELTLEPPEEPKVPKVTAVVTDQPLSSTRRVIPVPLGVTADFMEAAKPDFKAVAPTAVEQVMRVVEAANALFDDGTELLENLIAFRTGGEAMSPAKAVSAIQAISVLKDVLK